MNVYQKHMPLNVQIQQHNANQLYVLRICPRSPLSNPDVHPHTLLLLSSGLLHLFHQFLHPLRCLKMWRRRDSDDNKLVLSTSTLSHPCLTHPGFDSQPNAWPCNFKRARIVNRLARQPQYQHIKSIQLKRIFLMQ